MIEATFFSQARGMERERFAIRLTLPIESADGDAFCEVSVGDERPSRVHGVDNLQALNLAMKYARNRLSAVQDRGLRFYMTMEDDEPFDPKAIYFS